MTRSALILVSLLLGWVLLLRAMQQDVASDPFNPSLQGSYAYGHNGPGAFARGRSISAVEFAFFAAILVPPWTRRLWPRSVGLAVIFAPWALLSLFSCMHAGGVWVLHGLWILGLAGFLSVLSVGSVLTHLAAHLATHPATQTREP